MDKHLVTLELQEIVNSLCRLEKYPEIQVIFNGMKSANGRAYTSQNLIKISDNVFSENEPYWTAVAIHEACHFFYKQWYNVFGIGTKKEAHGFKFKEFEIKHLDMFGMRPIYKRAYWKYLLDSSTDEILWVTWKLRLDDSFNFRSSEDVVK